MRILTFFLAFILSYQTFATIEGMGIGGGGALAGISFDPALSGHVYVGTDMGLVYESFDFGKNWTPISQKKIKFNMDLNYQSHMGFDNNGGLYWASGGCDPQLSRDRGVTWQPFKSLAAKLPQNCLAGKTRIIYWFFSNDDSDVIGVGTTSGLLLSLDKGNSWNLVFENQESLASKVFDKDTLYHATNAGIYKFNLRTNQAESLLSTPLAAAAMGQDAKGITLVGAEKSDGSSKKLFIKPAGEDKFSSQQQPVGQFVRMNPNNSSIVYFTGRDRKQDNAEIWMSEDAGAHWVQRFTDDASAYRAGKINPNPVGLYVGFWDSSYFDFQVSPNNPDIIACGGNFFFKISTNKGELWQFPYAKLSTETSKITKADFWKSTKLNPVSVFFIKKSPVNKNMIVAGLADIGCVLSQDNGSTWRMCNIPNMNTTYDIAFNPDNPNQLIAAASTIHDFPDGWHGDIQNDAPGGIFISDDTGVTWKRLSPDTHDYQNPYLSLAIDFKQTPCHIYAGTQGKGIVASFDCGGNWQRLNQGFEPMDSSTNSSDQKGSLIFPSIKISPLTGDVYALHTGNRLWQNADNPYALYSGLYKLNKKTNTWIQLGRPPTVQGPGPVSGNLYWKYPFDFAVDWSNPKKLYLVDTGTAGTWKITGLWSSSDEGKTWEQVLHFDLARKVYLKNGKALVVGWADPEEPFMYLSDEKGNFSPVKLELPMQRVDDLSFDEGGFLFATFGGGIFKWDMQ
jgi:photosystem II stability/assembly factor-like uncharacterized protein